MQSKNLRLTNRDLAILNDVYDNTLLTFAQLSARHFHSAARVTAQNRLSQIVEAKLLNRMRVGSVVYKADPKFIGVIYSMTRLGLRRLQSLYPEMAIRDEPVVLDTSCLVHDLELVGILDFLKKRFSRMDCVNSKNISRASKHMTRQPDIVGFLPNGDSLVAIELDLTVKSERTYREIVNQYSMTNDYKIVLYVVGSKAIADKIKEVITGIKTHLNDDSFDTGKFYFVLLQDVLDNSKAAVITNGQKNLNTEISKYLPEGSLAS